MTSPRFALFPWLACLLAALMFVAPAQAQITIDDDDGATTIVIDDPNFEPMRIAIANFLATDDLGLGGGHKHQGRQQAGQPGEQGKSGTGHDENPTLSIVKTM
ncbi:MAG: hypothetical protein AAGB15_03660, partial [Pseudomonadota bacterium]